MTENNPDRQLPLTPRDCWNLLSDHWRTWVLSMGLCAAAALLYALFMTRNWEAVQGLLVRDEASAHSAKQPGKFADLYEMRSFQETILEVAKSHQVLSSTLSEVEGASGGKPVEPSAEAIEKLRKNMTMLPPNGAEFGKTEIFYLAVKDPRRERAIQLVQALCRQLSVRLGELRVQRSGGLIAEVNQQVELASEMYEKENDRLIAFESEVGADLGELRLLHSASGGQSDLRQQAVEMEQETRLNESRLRQGEELLSVLKAAQSDPAQLIAMPSSLLKFQPTLQRLKDGLVDAQLRASALSGMRTPDHPHVRAAEEAVESIREELHRELAVAVMGLEIEIDLSRDRLGVLQSQLSSLQKRLGNLASLRAEYSSRLATVENSRSVLTQARKQMSEIQAKQVGAQSAALVTPLDVPDTGPHPVGIGRTSVLGLGALGGLMVGVGWVFLSISPSAHSTSFSKEKELPSDRDFAEDRPSYDKPSTSEKVEAAVAAARRAAQQGKAVKAWSEYDAFAPKNSFSSTMEASTFEPPKDNPIIH